MLILLCLAYLELQEPDGLHTICYYNHLGDTIAITINYYDTCPMQIQVPH